MNKKKVAFICVHNSCRSQIAEALGKHLASDVDVYKRQGEYPEAVAVMLFYQVGEFFQSLAVERSRKSISDLMDIRPVSYIHLI